MRCTIYANTHHLLLIFVISLRRRAILLLILCYFAILAERIMKKGEGEEREVPTHLIENSKLTHAACVTKTSRYVAHHELAKEK